LPNDAQVFPTVIKTLCLKQVIYFQKCTDASVFIPLGTSTAMRNTFFWGDDGGDSAVQTYDIRH
jgi:hypothetical protein